jgi:hypothetical protein
VLWRAFSSANAFVRFTLIRRAGVVLFSAVITLLAPSAPADSGIAARYPGDKNIGSDPAVILADDFEAYTSTSQLTTTNKWTSASKVTNMRFATEAGNVFAGSKSLEMQLQVSTIEVSDILWKVLSPTRDVAFIRAYLKFDPNYNAHGHNGIHFSAKYPGPGIKPAADGTGFFNFLLQNDTEGRPGETDPGYTHLYAYWPKQRSNFGDHWYPDGTRLAVQQRHREQG